jgi:hypothetical protein
MFANRFTAVIAAAIKSKTDIIVTENLKDFPKFEAPGAAINN